MWRRRKKASSNTTWVSWSHRWEENGILDYGRGFVYRNASGHIVVLPRELVVLIRDQKPSE